MVFRKEQVDFAVRVTAENSGNFLKCLSRNDDLFVIRRSFKFHRAQRDSVSVQGGDPQNAVADFKEFALHHLVVVVGRRAENRLLDQRLQKKLAERHCLVFCDGRKIWKLFARLSRNVENNGSTGNGNGVSLICFDADQIIRKFLGDVAEDSGIDGNSAFFHNRAVCDGRNPQFRVIGRKGDLVGTCVYKDTFENRHGRVRRNRSGNGVDSLEKILFAE